MFLQCVSASSSLTALYKKSDEYKKLQSVLDPMLDRSFMENRGKAPKYNSNFLWQVAIYI